MTDEITFYFKIDNGEVKWLVRGTGKPSSWTEKSRENGDMVSFEEAHAAVVADPEHGIEAVPASNDVFTVENTPGAALPSTGGPGTNMIYLLGIALIGLAGAGLTLRSRGKAT